MVKGAEVAGFAAADAAFTGFRVVWERPWAVAIWAGVRFVVALAVNLFVAYAAGPATAQLAQVSLASPADVQKMASLLQDAAPTQAAAFFVELVLTAVLYAAMNRAVLRPAESRFGYLRLASDELRQLGLFVILLLLLLGFEIAVLFVAAVIVAVLSVALGGAAAVGASIASAILIPVSIGIFFFFGVRLSLASPLTFASGRVNVFGSWAMTRGRFWPLFGTYLIAFALGFVVLLLTKAIAVLAVAILGGGGTQAITAAIVFNPTSVAEILAPSGLAYMVIVSIGSALAAPITMCPPVTIYQSLSATAPTARRAFD
jgi:hypothetical protein